MNSGKNGEKSPPGIPAFDALMKKLANVPKEELDAEQAKYADRRKKKAEKPKT